MFKFFALCLALGGWAPLASAQHDISPQGARAMVERGEAILLDVREAEEVRDGMAEGAFWLPMSVINEQGPEYHRFIANLDRGKAVIVYCASGRRAGKFVEHLRDLGFDAFNMGGFDDWVNAGLPAVRPAPVSAISWPVLTF